MNQFIRSYDLIKPHASVSILKTDDGRIRYHISEPEVSPEKRKLFQKILALLNDSSNPDLFEWNDLNGPNKLNDLNESNKLNDLNESRKSDELNDLVGSIDSTDSKTSAHSGDSVSVLEKSISKLLDLYSIHLTESDFEVLKYYIRRDFYEFGAVWLLLNDPDIEDISCSGGNLPIYVFHRQYGSVQTNIVLSEDEADKLVRKMAQCSGKQISVAEPMTDAVLPDGSRAQLTLGNEITTKGSTFTIRRFNEKPFTPYELVQNGTFTAEMTAYLWLCAESNMNLMFAGGTASGKTTSLNAVCRFIPIDKKIVSIEDTREINLPHLNWISGVSRIKQKTVGSAGSAGSFGSFSSVTSAGSAETAAGEISLYDLLKASLRQRPEYILVGEVRGSEAYVLFQAMSTGHTTVSTMHAESVDTLIHRLENPPMNVPRVMIQTLDVLVILAQTEDEGRFSKKCLSIYEILETDPQTSEILTQEIFSRNENENENENEKMNLEKSSVLEKTRIRKGWTDEKLKNEFERRVSEIQKIVGNLSSDSESSVDFESEISEAEL
ncbi:hypothetical protein MmiAt1_11380 [Methanimicrococcus sp. At1]|uniref:Bacterial type II secretion system protein E domain-containing protein n=1 Tax=Methanimicrococcus hacksteinii TaxID=3028293 RepID=A0ABU3VQH4_9EURY|nr:type II/IV secretion system ATPase subunit [Methanimicrococcus sp. At1]MDV0445554.1 hypothetical protein [Methanimicrococcus sp. At1]